MTHFIVRGSNMRSLEIAPGAPAARRGTLRHQPRKSSQEVPDELESFPLDALRLIGHSSDTFPTQSRTRFLVKINYTKILFVIFMRFLRKSQFTLTKMSFQLNRGASINLVFSCQEAVFC